MHHVWTKLVQKFSGLVIISGHRDLALVSKMHEKEEKRVCVKEKTKTALLDKDSLVRRKRFCS